MAPTPDALHAFAVFAEHRNFTRAADALRISQPALHAKVAKLARELGRPLYHRSGRQLVLTPDGEAVARFARDHDDRLARFLAELRATPLERPVVLAAGQGAFLYLLADALRAATTERLRLLNTDRAATLAAVRTGRAHLGVTVLDVLPDDLVAIPLATFPQVVLAPEAHPLARRKRLRLRDLDGAALVVPPPTRPHRIALERALRAAGVRWTVAVEADGWPLAAHFAGLGVGLAVVNGCVPPGPGLVARTVTDLPPVPYHVVHRPGSRDDPRVEELLARIRGSLG